MINYKITSLKQTQRFAGFLANELLKAKIKNKNALVLALTGDLGTGKTSFTQGFLRGLGIKKKIISPTFVLVKNYKLRTANYKQAYHADCYRIKKAAELKTLGLKEIFNNPQNIVLVEWAERIRRALPQNAIWLKFEHGEKENERKIRI